jgi:1-aminocyclopropane-1-carboxylate deaminase
MDLVKEYTGGSFANFEINFNYHFGGYAKIQPALIDFIKDFEHRFGIQLEPVYTGKMFYGLIDLIGNDYFPSGCTIVAIHTGGLQGLTGYPEYFSSCNPVFSD